MFPMNIELKIPLSDGSIPLKMSLHIASMHELQSRRQDCACPQ